MFYTGLTLAVAVIVVVTLRESPTTMGRAGAVAVAVAVVAWTITAFTGNLLLLYIGSVSALFGVVLVGVWAAASVQNRKRDPIE